MVVMTVLGEIQDWRNVTMIVLGYLVEHHFMIIVVSVFPLVIPPASRAAMGPGTIAAVSRNLIYVVYVKVITAAVQAVWMSLHSIMI
jgi:hypothetical protein